MRVAVLSLTRDRLAYTQHCFETLRKYAGCEYDHYVLDQGSVDGTQDWLLNDYDPKYLDTLTGNIGVSLGINQLLEAAGHNYEWYVKFDNDCELLTEGTLAAATDPALSRWMVSPRILGLDHPPREEWDRQAGGLEIGETTILGGIFMPMPYWVFSEYRHNPFNPIWGMDDVHLVSWFRAHGGQVGYMKDFYANHFKTTKGQREDNVGGYYTRKEAEFHN